MAEIPAEILAEKEQIEIVVFHIKSIILLPDKSIIELAAIGAFIHNFYNGSENILKQTFKLNGISFQKTPNWHKALLNKAIAENIITEKLGNTLFEFLSFRHYFVHGYGHMLKGEQLLALAENLPDVWDDFYIQIEKYYREK